MKRLILLFVGLLAAGHVMAQSASDPLDLRVGDQSDPHASDAQPQGDPPGTYYGDTSGKPASPISADGAAATDEEGKARVWGSFTTGIGHAKGYGTTHFNAAEVNVSKSFGDGERKNTVNMSIRIDQNDGPGFGGRYPYFDPEADYPFPPPR